MPVRNTRNEVVAAVNINMYPASADKIKIAKSHVPILQMEVHELELTMRAHNVNGTLGRT